MKLLVGCFGLAAVRLHYQEQDVDDGGEGGGGGDNVERHQAVGVAQPDSGWVAQHEADSHPRVQQGESPAAVSPHRNPPNTSHMGSVVHCEDAGPGSGFLLCDVHHIRVGGKVEAGRPSRKILCISFF